MSLGNSLRGGDEKVEEVRLGLLGFKRDVEGLKSIVDERRKEVEALVKQRKEIRRQMQVGLALSNIGQSLRELEQSLMMTSNESYTDNGEKNIDHGLSDSGEESDEGHQGGMSISRLGRHARQYLLIQRMMKRVGSDHPFVIKQGARMAKMKNMILLDLGNALK